MKLEVLSALVAARVSEVSVVDVELSSPSLPVGDKLMSPVNDKVADTAEPVKEKADVASSPLLF